ncbi:ferredoxin [Candidatus Woesearchaeota archaeon]|nr:MAG: ferredoxin [Candidatus Woesearchaeota archaeon]
MAKVTHDKETCIGCGACASVCEKFWEMNDEEGKSVLKGAKKNPETGFEELEVESEEDIKCNQEAADSCPVNCIKVEK